MHQNFAVLGNDLRGSIQETDGIPITDHTCGAGTTFRTHGLEIAKPEISHVASASLQEMLGLSSPGDDHV